ncbi:MAG TPA: phosphoenolpyruvate carboxykinase, partial [Parachlamydiales bacterium]|nr:phosphoenolpyruvate carboxykinase [Parachlamydiales bacterium]
KIYYVKWVKDYAEGKFVWPGFGENSRILKWIFERSSNRASAKKTAIGSIPDSLDLSGLEISKEKLSTLFAIDREAWLKECDELKNYFKLFASRLPSELLRELDELSHRLH